MLTYLSVPFCASRSYASGEVSSSAGGLIIWPAKLLILARLSRLLTLQWFSEVVKRHRVIIYGLAEDEESIAGHQAAAEAEAARLLALQSESGFVDPSLSAPRS